MIAERLRRLAGEKRARWEAICRQCGQCCYEKEIRGLSAAVTNYRHPCIHLDTITRTCTVYENRFQTCSQCRRMTIWHALFVRWLPESCGYVQRYRVWARHAYQWRADPWARRRKNRNPPNTRVREYALGPKAVRVPRERGTTARCG